MEGELVANMRLAYYRIFPSFFFPTIKSALKPYRYCASSFFEGVLLVTIHACSGLHFCCQPSRLRKVNMRVQLISCTDLFRRKATFLLFQNWFFFSLQLFCDILKIFCCWTTPHFFVLSPALNYILTTINCNLFRAGNGARQLYIFSRSKKLSR